MENMWREDAKIPVQVRGSAKDIKTFRNAADADGKFLRLGKLIKAASARRGRTLELLGHGNVPMVSKIQGGRRIFQPTQIQPSMDERRHNSDQNIKDKGSIIMHTFEL